ncbi:MAG: hypothetical protein ACREM6_08905 [Vulcanimicrobiaceae bacterium]
MRLADGGLAAVTAGELAANRARYQSALRSRVALAFAVLRSAPRAVVALSTEPAPAPLPTAPAPLVDPAFEEKVAAYLKATEVWAPPDRPEPAERHFIRKKRRAAQFEARSSAP